MQEPLQGKSDGIHVHVNARTPIMPKSLRNITNIMYSKEDLIYKALQVDVNREHRYCKKVEEDFLQSLNQGKSPKPWRRSATSGTREMMAATGIIMTADTTA